MSDHDIPCGSCGAVGAFDLGCDECRATDPTTEEEQAILPCEVRAFRNRLGLTQARLATLLPVPKRTLENWEAGLRNPPDYLTRALRDLERELAAVTRPT